MPTKNNIPGGTGMSATKAEDGWPLVNKNCITSPAEQNTKEQIALWWLKHDFLLLPVQPNTKKLVHGFGMYQDKIQTGERASQWFSEKSLANLAVCGTQTSLILDFDDTDLYKSWASKFPEATRTYTEQTPRGGYHVFAHAWQGSLKGVTLIKGVELKRVVLIYPSVVDNKPYIRGEGDLLKVDAEILLSPLSETPIAKNAQRVDVHDKGYLQKIKSAFSCLDLIQSANPKLKVYRSSNRFVTLPCPFHEDKKPSFWIDTQRNLWGCHACGVRGDVINLFARLNGITNKEAIREMGKSP
jgi:hypothetical protein